MYSCEYCPYASNWSSNLRKHEKAMHKSSVKNCSPSSVHSNFQPINNQVIASQEETYDIRLKENFRLFVSGPSRCGKTVFILKLLENINSFAQQPPSTIIHVYKVWQPNYDELQSLGVNFMVE